MSFIIALTDQEAINFFENTLGIASNTRLALVPQGITRLEYLTELGEEDIKTLAETLRRPGGIVPDTWLIGCRLFLYQYTLLV